MSVRKTFGEKRVVALVRMPNQSLQRTLRAAELNTLCRFALKSGIISDKVFNLKVLEFESKNYGIQI